MPSFTVLRDDKGIGVHLTQISPAMVRSLLGRAVRRTLEWDLGARHNLGRVCTDGTLSHLTSRKISAFEKGCVRSLFCNAIYTRAKA
eukprot:8057108-Pyramimonas_sp.AAC.1